MPKIHPWGNNFPSRSDKSFWGRWHKTKVTYVHDGDSFWVAKRDPKGEPIRVRLADWHAPELKSVGGCTAKALLELILPKGTAVEIKPEIPHFHRLVAEVRKDGIKVNRVLSRIRVTAKRNDTKLCPVKPFPKATWGKRKKKG